MHIDVNNAFLSWEAIYLLNNGYKYDIRNSYAVIGGDEASRKGIVLAKSNSAKKLGIKTAETLYQARQKCKVLRVYKPHFAFYNEMSNKLMELIKKYTPDLEQASIDECYIDYTKVSYLYGDYMDFAKKLMTEIKETLGFTVNIGIANNKLCAKMASDFSKPSKIHTLFCNEIEEKMYILPIEDLFGIGKKTSLKLRNIGINTIGDLANYNQDKLSIYFKNQAIKMINSAKGIDNSEVISEIIESKGLSHSTTLAKDLTQKKEVYLVLLKLAEILGREIRKMNKYAYVITTFLKNSDFVVTSHQKKLLTPTDSTDIIFKTSKILLDEMWKEEKIRLVGIRLNKLTDKRQEQLSIFDKPNNNDDSLNKVIDSLKEKYGPNIMSSNFKNSNAWITK